MKVLIIINKNQVQRILVDIDKEYLIKDLEELLTKNKYTKAIMLALSKGKCLGEIIESDLYNLKVDLMIRENNVCWDLTR